MLKITNLRYEYKGTDEVYNYSMSVQAGETVAILGQSGSGKSTLLDLVAGFLSASGGSIKLENNDLTDLPVEKRPMSILFQNHNLFEHLSVRKNILLGVSKRLKESKEEIQKVQKILKEVGLEKYEHTLASSLSGGQQQRVALARVLIRKEPILLLDEPFTGLDLDTKIQMLDLVQKITIENHLHTIMVTHDMQDAKHIASRVYRVQNHTLTEQ